MKKQRLFNPFTTDMAMDRRKENLKRGINYSELRCDCGCRYLAKSELTHEFSVADFQKTPPSSIEINYFICFFCGWKFPVIQNMEIIDIY